MAAMGSRTPSSTAATWAASSAYACGLGRSRRSSVSSDIGGGKGGTGNTGRKRRDDTTGRIRRNRYYGYAAGADGVGASDAATSRSLTSHSLRAACVSYDAREDWRSRFRAKYRPLNPSTAGEVASQICVSAPRSGGTKNGRASGYTRRRIPRRWL